MDLFVSSTFGNIEICLPITVKLQESQIVTGIIVGIDGSYSLRNYPNWVKFSPVISSVNLSHLSEFGYDIDLLYIKHLPKSTDEKYNTNYMGIKLMLLTDDVSNLREPQGEIFLMDKNKKYFTLRFSKIRYIIC
jgi:hypothetical protein